MAKPPLGLMEWPFAGSKKVILSFTFDVDSLVEKENIFRNYPIVICTGFGIVTFKQTI